MARQEPQWGEACVCGDAQLIHRGDGHDGSCSAMHCALNVVRGWAYGSRCVAFAAYVREEPAIPDAPVGLTP